MSTPRLAALDNGSHFHRRALYHPRFRRYFDRLIELRQLADTDLDDIDVLVVTDRCHPGLLCAARPRLHALLAAGKTVVAMAGTRPELWLPAVVWRDEPVNFWWWKTPGATLGLYTPTPRHTLFDHIGLDDASWHFHGVLSPPPGVSALIGFHHRDGCLLYEDCHSTPGRLIVCTLDPFYHFGSWFMPVTGRFLDGFLRYLRTLRPCQGD